MTDRQAWSRLWLAAAFALLPFAARAELAVSANDNKAVLENGVIATVANAEPDTVSIIDLSASPPQTPGRDTSASERRRSARQRRHRPG